jgi:hypothetical protein
MCARIQRPFISGPQVRALVRPPPSLRKSAPFRRQAGKPPLRPFLAISSSHFSGSVKSIRSPGRFRPAGLRPQKSRSRRGRGAEARHLGVAMVFQFPGVRVPRNYLHHPVLPNRAISNRVQIVMCRDFRYPFRLLLVSADSVVSGGDFGGPVSASHSSRISKLRAVINLRSGSS